MEIVHRTAPRPREEITRNYELHELNGLLAAALDFLSADCADYRDFGLPRSIFKYEFHELSGLLAAAFDFLSADCADYRDLGIRVRFGLRYYGFLLGCGT